MGRLEDKVAIVTGAASGIGLAVCEDFLKHGARVVATDIDSQSLEKALPTSSDVMTCTHDVSDETAWESVIEATSRRFGAPSIVVNNAGIGDPFPIVELPLDEWKRVLAVNLDGVFLGCRAGMRAMGQSGGSIVNIASVHAMVAASASAGYVASKGAVRTFTKQAATEGASAGIRVNSVHPGYIETPLLRESMRKMAEAGEDADLWHKQMTALHPIGRLGQASEVAKCVTFLASDDASFVTGSELVVDGGYLAR